METIKKSSKKIIWLSLLLLPFSAQAKLNIPNPASGVLPDWGGAQTPGGVIAAIINIMLSVAGLLAVVFLIIGGFRYITSAGNEETAEKAKKTIQNAIIGLIVIILSFVVVRVINNALG